MSQGAPPALFFSSPPIRGPHPDPSLRDLVPPYLVISLEVSVGTNRRSKRYLCSLSGLGAAPVLVNPYFHPAASGSRFQPSMFSACHLLHPTMPSELGVENIRGVSSHTVPVKSRSRLIPDKRLDLITRTPCGSLLGLFTHPAEYMESLGSQCRSTVSNPSGYVRRGRLHLLFSAGRPLGERQLGVEVPRTFKPLDVGPVIYSQPRLPGHLSTNTVRELVLASESRCLLPRTFVLLHSFPPVPQTHAPGC